MPFPEFPLQSVGRLTAAWRVRKYGHLPKGRNGITVIPDFDSACAQNTHIYTCVITYVSVFFGAHWQGQDGTATDVYICELGLVHPLHTVHTGPHPL